MAQQYIKLNNTVIRQPDAGLGYNFETTYQKDAKRTQRGNLKSTPMFTVESYSYKATLVTKAEMATILGIIAKGNSFNLYRYSPYYGTWRTDKFYVGKGSLEIGCLKEDSELFESLSFNMIGVNPI